MSKAANQLRYLMAPLDQWRLDPAVDEIAINKPGEVFVRRNGMFTRYDVPLDYDDLYDIAVLAGALNEQNVNSTMPLLAADLPDGERLQAVLPPCVSPGTVSLTMRVHSSIVPSPAAATKRYKLDRWNQWERRNEARKAENALLLAAYDSGDIVKFLEEIVRLKFSPILCGKTGAGKTTMLKTIVSMINPNERIITIENALEVDVVNQPNHVRLLYSRGGQSAAKVTQKDLLEAYLRMRPDRGCVGELSDNEAAYTYASECMTGHPGSPSTIHGRTAPEAARRLLTLFQGSNAGRGYPPDMIIDQLAMTVDVIIPFQEDSGVYEIAEVWLAPDAERRGKNFRELLEG